MVDVDEVENGLRRVAPLFRSNKKTLLVCFMGHKGFSAEVGSPGKYVPSYLFPESAIYALAKAVEYSERLARPESCSCQNARYQSGKSQADYQQCHEAEYTAAYLAFDSANRGVTRLLWHSLCRNEIRENGE